MQRIGLFGGSFNPIHKGHLIMAECFINSLQLDKCVLIPTGVSPFKHSDDYNLFTSEQRLAMVETACEDNPKLIVWDYEIKKGGTSYSIDTILYAKKIFPEAELFWLIGKDHIATFTKWKDWQAIIANVKLAIVNRDSHLDYDTTETLNKSIGKESYSYVEAPLIDISSSYIRENINNITEIKNMLPGKIVTFFEME